MSQPLVFAGERRPPRPNHQPHLPSALSCYENSVMLQHTLNGVPAHWAQIDATTLFDLCRTAGTQTHVAARSQDFLHGRVHADNALWQGPGRGRKCGWVIFLLSGQASRVPQRKLVPCVPWAGSGCGCQRLELLWRLLCSTVCRCLPPLDLLDYAPDRAFIRWSTWAT